MEDRKSAFREALKESVAQEWEDRYEYQRGMLTDTDRRFLWGLKEYPHESTVSDRRTSIRSRVEAGLRDLSYLSMLSERSRESVFTDLEDHTPPGQLRDAVASLVEFLYIGLDGDQEWFEEAIAHGISNAESELREGDFYAGAGVDAGVDVEIDVTRGYDVDEIEKRFRAGRGHTLTPTEVGVLVVSGCVTPEDLAVIDHNQRERFDPDTGEIEDPGPNPILEPPTPDENHKQIDPSDYEPDDEG